MKELVKHTIKVIEIDGQPWGRFENPLTLIDCDGNAYPSEYHGEISDNNEDYYEFEKYAYQHQLPFPGATIGDVIEADKVEVSWQYHDKQTCEWVNIENPNALDAYFVSVLGNYRACHYETRQIYRLKQQWKDDFPSPYPDHVSATFRPDIIPPHILAKMQADREAHKRQKEQQPVSEYEKCYHPALIDTGTGYYHCQVCDKSFSKIKWEMEKSQLPKLNNMVEPVSEQPKETAEQAADDFLIISEINSERIRSAFIAGVEWQKQQEGK